MSKVTKDVSFLELMKLFGRDFKEIKKEESVEVECGHEYIPLFTSYCCKYCGKKQEK